MAEEANGPSYRFALQPKWLLLHVAALIALAVMIGACFWQLSRLEEKQDRNRLYDTRAAQPVQPVLDVVPVGSDEVLVDQVRFRRLEATGVYRADEEVFVRSRSLDGQPGAWVLTPLVLEGRPGQAVVVNRGWIPANTTTPSLPAGAEAPTGTVTVTGLVMAGETRGALGTVDASGVRLSVLARADIERLAQQVEEQLLPVYLQLEAQQPPSTQALPVVLPPPQHDEGPHKSYAGQWAIFSVIWLIGYPMLIRRAAQRRAAERHEAGEGPPTATGAPNGTTAETTTGDREIGTSTR